jgi:hypothetical protein
MRIAHVGRLFARLKHPDLVRALLIWLVYIFVIETIARALTFDPKYGVPANFTEMHHNFIGSARTVPVLCRWDCTWYVSIATAGYPGKGGSAPYNAAFFPLYGLAMRAVAKAFHIAPSWAGAWISRFALLGSIALMPYVGKQLGYSRSRSWAAVCALLASSNGFMMLAVYADGLFLMLTLVTVALMLSGRSWWAIIPAVLAGMTRVHAFGFVVGLVGFGVWRYSRGHRELPAHVLPALGCAAGIGAVMAFDYSVSGNPLLFMSSQNFFGRKGEHGALSSAFLRFFSELRGVSTAGIPPRSMYEVYTCGYVATFATTVIVSLYLFLRKRWGELACITAAYGVLMMSGTQWGVYRYSAATFPIWFSIAALSRWRVLWAAVLALGVVHQTLLLVNFAAANAPGP